MANSVLGGTWQTGRSRCRRLLLGTWISVLAMGLSARAGEEWAGSDLLIYGDKEAGTVYTKVLDGETLSAAHLRLGTTLGSAELRAKDSKIALTGNFYLGYLTNSFTTLTSRLSLTNSTLSCSIFNTGNDVNGGYGYGNERLTVDLGPGGVLSCSYLQHYAQPYARIDFRGGRIVLTGTASGTSSRVALLQGHTCVGGWPNAGMRFNGVDGPIDIEINRDAYLARGWALRQLDLLGTKGFVKRGTGTLFWGWHTEGNNNGYLNRMVTYTGDTIVQAGGIKLSTWSTATNAQVANETPTNSVLVVESGAFFDVNGETATFAGVRGEGLVTNSAETAGTFVFGFAEGVSEFAPARVAGAINIVQAGCGMLKIGSETLGDGSLFVSNGTVKVTSPKFSAARIVVARGGSLDVRGVVLDCPDFVVEPGASIRQDATGAQSYTVAADEDVSYVAGQFASGGTLTKTGVGTATLIGPCAKGAGTVMVQEGRVVCRPASTYAGKFFRLNYFGDAAGNTGSGVSFSEFSLYGVSGGRVNAGRYVYRGIGPYSQQEAQNAGLTHLTYGGWDGITDATMLEEYEVAAWRGTSTSYYFQHSKDCSPAKVFDGMTSTMLHNTYYLGGCNVIVFRLPADTADVMGFTFTTSSAPAQRPCFWKLEGSSDGASWMTLASNVKGVAKQDMIDSTPTTAYTEYNGGVPYLLTNMAWTAGAPFGAAKVSVAAGATLEFESEQLEIAALEVDLTAGAGTITRFTPTEGGALYLTNLVAGATFIGHALPITVQTVAQADNLKTWKVYVNGTERPDLGVRAGAGTLSVVGSGMLLIFR